LGRPSLAIDDSEADPAIGTELENPAIWDPSAFDGDASL
jgi:hypothetical protein